MNKKVHCGYWLLIAALGGALVLGSLRQDPMVFVGEHQPASEPPPDTPVAAAPAAAAASADAAVSLPKAPPELSEQWNGQAVDEDWAPDAERDIHDAASAAGKDTQMLAAACRASLCRVELLHKDESAQEAFIQGFPAHIHWRNHGQMHIQERTEAGIKTVVFVARDEQ